jgi:nucleotide-binding universal stress UspA family protein
MKVLMGIGESKLSDDLLQAVVSQFRSDACEVRVLHVLQPILPVAVPEMAQGYAPELVDERKLAHELVERMAASLRSAGFKADTAVEVGDVRECILDYATEWKADLIVVGAHAQRGIQRFLLGSVAESVARHARCSVQIVRKSAAI